MSIRLSGILVAGLSLGFVACGGDSLTLPPSSGDLEITTTTGGSEPDADGYTVQVDAQQPQAIATAGTLRVSDLTPGAHNVLLSGMAPNCSVAGDNPRSLTVAVGETTSATFELTCGSTTGGLEVTSQTSGADQDADGYSISVDGSDQGPLGANATVTLGNLAPGSHVVGLAGVANNCSIDGDPLRAVTVSPGQTASVTFAVTCSQLPPDVGNLQITTNTSGTDQDDNGYQFSLDGGQPRPIGINSTALLTSIAVGQHSVVLSNVAGNCNVDDDSKDVTITSGQTAALTFTITCGAIPPTTGTIHVTTTTSGDNQDTDGYAFKIDNGQNQPIGLNGAQDVANVPVGVHTVVLSGLASNCRADDPSQQAAVLPGGTANVAFAVTCQAIPPSASRSSMLADPRTIPTGGTSTITVTVRDASGRALAGIPVTLDITGTGNSTTTASPGSDVTNQDGDAVFTFSSTDAGDKTVTATAGGVKIKDTEVITVFRRTSTIQITSDPDDPSTSGQPITVGFTVTVEGGGTPTGTVDIFSLEEGDVGCHVDVSAGSCTFPLNSVGLHHLQASYSGDNQFTDSLDPDGEEHTVNPATP
jgi:hypothetical protein